MVALNSEPKLLEVIRALAAPRRLTCRLDRREQQADERADDRDHDEKLDQRKAASPPPTDKYVANAATHAKRSFRVAHPDGDCLNRRLPLSFL